MSVLDDAESLMRVLVGDYEAWARSCSCHCGESLDGAVVMIERLLIEAGRLSDD